MEKQHPAGRPYWIDQPHLQALPVIGPGGSRAINKKPGMEAVLRVAPDLIRQADLIYTFLVGHAVAGRMQADFAPLGQPIAFDEK